MSLTASQRRGNSQMQTGDHLGLGTLLLKRQILGENLRAAAMEQRSAQDQLQFADVPRPGMASQLRVTTVVESRDSRHARPLSFLCQKLTRERFQVNKPVAQS